MSKTNFDDLLNAMEGAHKRTSQIDRWLSANEGKKEELLEALLWYSENRTNRFGWRLLLETLRQRDGWGSFPGTYKSLFSWAKANFPELF